MGEIFTARFWKDAAERAVKTFAQAGLATLGVGSVDIVHTNWIGVLSVAGGAAVVSVLTSLLSEPRGDAGTASVVKLDPDQ